MSERGNEFSLWSGRFIKGCDSYEEFSLEELPPSFFKVTETREEIHKRLNQDYILKQMPRKPSNTLAER